MEKDEAGAECRANGCQAFGPGAHGEFMRLAASGSSRYSIAQRFNVSENHVRTVVAAGGATKPTVDVGKFHREAMKRVDDKILAEPYCPRCGIRGHELGTFGQCLFIDAFAQRRRDIG